MTTPLFWLGLSILLVAICLAVVLAVAIPAFLELSRAARSAEKLFDTLSRDLPPTLEALRLTGLEVKELTDGLGDGVESAGRVVKQVDRSLQDTKQQVQNVEVATRSTFAGVKAAWKTLTSTPRKPHFQNSSAEGEGRDRNIPPPAVEPAQANEAPPEVQVSRNGLSREDTVLEGTDSPPS